jgi:VWFA-related protein
MRPPTAGRVPRRACLGPRTRLALVALVAAGLLGVRGAGQGPAQDKPRFRSGIDLVVLDVSVLDGDRHPVRALTAQDFTVLEDGKPQTISSFTAVDVPDQPAEPHAAWTRSVAPDVSRNADFTPEGRVISLVLDDGTPMNAEEVTRVKTYGRKVIEEMGEADLGAVVFALDKRGGQEFTHDRQRLLAAIDRFNGGLLVNEFDGGKTVRATYDRFSLPALTLYNQTIGVLEGVADYLATLPQRRKAVFFVSVGVPIDVAAAVQRQNLSNGDDGGTVNGDLGRKFMRVCAAAARANVTVYAIDPGGLRVVEGTLNQRFLDSVAGNTGGFAILNTDDPAPGIKQAFQENASYYLLGYQPANTRVDGRFRRIEVRVNRPGLTVRSRTGYYEAEPSAKAATATASPLESAIAGTLPKTELSLQAMAAPFALSASRGAALAIVLGVRHAAAAGPGTAAIEDGKIGTAQCHLDVLVRAYDAHSAKLSGSERLKVDAKLRPDAKGEVSYEVLSRIDLKPGRYQLRLAAESALPHLAGSIFFDVTVPDFSKSPLSLSGLLLSTSHGPIAAPKNKLLPLVPVVPTTRREFGADDRVAGFVRVYAAGGRPATPATVTIRITDGRDATLVETREALEGERFSPDGMAEYRFEVPVDRLAAGPYLLTVEARRGAATARRDARFTMR